MTQLDLHVLGPQQGSLFDDAMVALLDAVDGHLVVRRGALLQRFVHAVREIRVVHFGLHDGLEAGARNLA